MANPLSNPAGNVAPRWVYQAILVEMTDKTWYGLRATQRHKEIRGIFNSGIWPMASQDHYKCDVHGKFILKMEKVILKPGVPLTPFEQYFYILPPVFTPRTPRHILKTFHKDSYVDTSRDPLVSFPWRSVIGIQCPSLLTRPAVNIAVNKIDI